jgi:hypothetical protein
LLGYLGNHDIAVVERSCMELDQHFVVRELRERLLGVKLEIVKAALAHDRPTLCSFWQRHGEYDKVVLNCSRYVKKLDLVAA